MLRKTAAAVASVVVLAMTAKHDGHENHWWWDNLNHFIGGFAVGILLPEGRERECLLGICVVWEAFEWKLATMKLYESFDWFPKGPRSMGYEEWELDHQCEDTLLDTVMAYQGMKAAKRLKEAT
jgi:hypothetical protein